MLIIDTYIQENNLIHTLYQDIPLKVLLQKLTQPLPPAPDLAVTMSLSTKLLSRCLCDSSSNVLT